MLAASNAHGPIAVSTQRSLHHWKANLQSTDSERFQRCGLSRWVEFEVESCDFNQIHIFDKSSLSAAVLTGKVSLSHQTKFSLPFELADSKD